MAAGTIVYSGGLVGTQPCHISQGGSAATMVGKPNINPTLLPTMVAVAYERDNKTIQTSQVYYANIYPQTIIINPSETSGGIRTLTVGSLSTNFSKEGSSGQNAARYTSFDSILCVLSADTTISCDAWNNTTIYNIASIANADELKFANDTDFICKISNSDLTNPETGWDAWGTEITSGEYDDMDSYTNTDYYEMTTTYLASKISNIEDFVKILPCSKMYCDGGPSGSLKIWNFDTEVWDTFTTISRSNGDYGGVGEVQGLPIGSTLDIADYVSSGDSYIRIAKSRGSFQIGFLGFYCFNPLNNT